VRKNEIKEQLESAKNNLSTANKSLELLVRQHDTMVAHNNELHHTIEELKNELRLYNWAFSIASGRLMAYSKTEDDPAVFTERLLDEARRELGITQQ
jgi:chromosome segregation ATPase